MTRLPPTLAVIPARYASHRFPGKPLADIDGLPMIVRVAQRVRDAKQVGRVLVATDDERIRTTIRDAGFEAIMTPSDCASGTDRVAHAVRLIGASPELVVNVQGDEPLIDPADIDVLISDSLSRDGGVGTLARPINEVARFEDPNSVKVVVGQNGRALYFSRSPVPHGADPRASDSAHKPLLHVGLYAYRPEVLARLTALRPSPLEKLERLEQLRAMEHGIPIHVTQCVSCHLSIGVDVPEDVEAVVRELHRRGLPNAS